MPWHTVSLTYGEKGAGTLRLATTSLLSPLSLFTNFQTFFLLSSSTSSHSLKQSRKQCISNPRAWPFCTSTLKSSNSLSFKLTIYSLTQLPFLTSVTCSLNLLSSLIIKMIMIIDYPLSHIHKHTHINNKTNYYYYIPLNNIISNTLSVTPMVVVDNSVRNSHNGHGRCNCPKST